MGEHGADEGAPASRQATASPRPPSRGKAVALLTAVFLLGGIAGGAAGRLTALREMGRMMAGPPPEARARFRMEAMRRHLDLRDDQLARVRAIMTEADAERDRLMDTCGPGLEELRRRTDDRVREVLDEEQRRRFDDMGSRRGKPHGPRHPPPP
jgi:hypothetical protein